MPEITMTIEELQQLIRQEAERAVAAVRTQGGVNAETAAMYLGISVDTLMTEARAFRIPHVRIRGRYIFHIPTLDQWIREQGMRNAQGVAAQRGA